MDNTKNIFRTEIDKIDDQILKLIEKRMEIARQIGLIKIHSAEKIYEPDREEEILTRLIPSGNLLRRNNVIKIFTSILEVSREVQSSR